MKWIDFLWYEDYGKQFFLNILQYKRFCVFQFSLDFPVYSGSSGIIMSIGHSSAFGISLHLSRFGFSFDILTWKARQLNYWRNGLDYFLKDNGFHEVSLEETNSGSSNCSSNGV